MSKEKELLVEELLVALGNYIAGYIGNNPKAKFKSNVEFANVCDINESTVRRILQGKQNISVKVLMRIAEALDINMSDFLKEMGY
jgi:transcriptional regulator with XRE-family HTH domain